ncbi:hypothetical protein GYRE_02772 [Yokenella regensburgei ATCC 49455]|jgi:CRISPR/Cas system CSM-associated protein Csm3 (group 7 of RAMP superfamily)|uniref:Lipoprotein n=1 Tax=Yokenella regensburgei TaxID=158877 RepID=A0AB38FZN7_9ENTR|nr:hypothetical protein HMPREF0880_01642 [Yokenella regensburgei ATCC 43003]KFD22850.1 hypothetical protein GYRE_02772 [Yokenella regensburgei ATCC 49455]SQA64864.1 Uncharacterised protein [Yokenella regensburgei]SQA95510.1 Uncharacterised protein [Yokenella regensburgei]SUQ03632.1 Uncharacterised protein [Yokenella regensburgei]
MLKQDPVVRYYQMLMLSGALFLAGCSSQSQETVNDIKSLSIPVVNQSVSSPTGEANSSLKGRHRDNSQRINTLRQDLKTEYLQNIRPEDVLDARNSEVQSVYAALTKLDELAAMNDHYLKESNQPGLEKISQVLKPLMLKS